MPLSGKGFSHIIGGQGLARGAAHT